MSRALRALLAALVIVCGVARPSYAAGAAADDVLVVGLTGKYPPFNFYDEHDALTGFDVAFAREVCKELGRRCDFRPLQWDGLIPALLAGRVDAIVGSMAITEARAKAVRFSAPYYESGAQLFVRPGAPEATAQGFAIGVTLGTTYEEQVRARWPAAVVRTFKGDAEALQDLAAGRLDGLVTDKLVGAYMAKASGITIEPRGPLLYEERLAIPVAPDRAELHAQIDAAVKRIRSSPRYQALFDTWFGKATTAQPTSPAKRIGWLLLQGLGATVRICLAGIGAGLVAAVALAFVLVGALGRAAKAVASTIVDFVRATPFLVQLLAIYFGLPSLGIGISAFASAVVAMALHSAAYLGAVLETAYASVPEGQHQAARALGLSRRESLVHVIAPQMAPVLTVPALNTVVAMIKDSAIVSVIGVYELTLQAQRVISVTFRPMELYAAAALLYFALTYPLLIAGRRLERRYVRLGLLRA